MMDFKFIFPLSICSFKIGNTLSKLSNLDVRQGDQIAYSGGLAGSIITASLELSSTTR